MVSRVRRSIVGSAVALTAATLSAGCAAGGGPGPHSASSSSTRPAASAARSAGPVTGAAAGCDRTAWHTTPLTVTHQVSVPPVPVVAGIRTAQHPECGYDRLVLEISGSMPSYSVSYVDRVISAASGVPIALPGQHYALITLRSAQAHSAAGTPTISRTVRLPGYPALRSWVLAGDTEGVVTIAVGLPAEASIRTGELPGRLYVDFRE
jgi:hypothetical protein